MAAKELLFSSPAARSPASPRWLRNTGTALTLGALACYADPTHDLGYRSGELAEENAGAPPVAVSTADFAGTWVGSADDPFALEPNAADEPPPFRFPSGSSRIRLQLTVPQDHTMTAGSIVFGEAPPPAPATDPDVGYAVDPNASVEVLTYDRGYPPPIEGFTYGFHPVIDGRDLTANGTDPALLGDAIYAIDGKLQGIFYPNEVFESWCPLQTAESCPPFDFIDEFGCYFGAEDRSGACLKRLQCLAPVCSCPEQGACSWSFDPYSMLTIRLSEEGLVGLFAGADFVNERGFRQPLGTVHFRREAPRPDP